MWPRRRATFSRDSAAFSEAPRFVAGPFSLADRMPPGKSLPLRPTISGLRSVRAPDLEAHAGPDIEPAYRVLTSMPAVTAEKTRTEGRLRSGKQWAIARWSPRTDPRPIHQSVLTQLLRAGLVLFAGTFMVDAVAPIQRLGASFDPSPNGSYRNGFARTAVSNPCL